MELYMVLIIVFVVVTVIIVVGLMYGDTIKQKFGKEGFQESRAGYSPAMQGIMISAGAANANPVNPSYSISGGESGLTKSVSEITNEFGKAVYDTVQNGAKEHDANIQQKESFFSLGEHALVNPQNVIEGARIHTNGILNNGYTYDDIIKNIQNDQPTGDGSVAGASQGNEFSDIWESYQKTQEEHDLNPTAVRSLEEIDQITKDINMGQNLASNNYLNRAGASKAKIKLEPWNTVGVIDGPINTPERDINRKIYSVNHAIPIKSYAVDSFDLSNEFTKYGPGFSKSFADNSKEVVTGIGKDAAKFGKIMN